MFIAITQNIVNIVASLLFVFVFGMKVEGVAREPSLHSMPDFSWLICSGCVITVLYENTSAVSNSLLMMP